MKWSPPAGGVLRNADMTPRLNQTLPALPALQLDLPAVHFDPAIDPVYDTGAGPNVGFNMDLLTPTVTRLDTSHGRPAESSDDDKDLFDSGDEE